MDNQEFYSKQSDISLKDTLGIMLLFIKMFVGGCLLYTGIYLTFWSVGIIEQFVNHPEKVPLINTILQSNVGSEVLKITTKGDSFIIENGLFFKWAIIMFIVLIIFNVIGRSLAAVFQCAIKLFTDLEIPNNGKSKSTNKS